MFLFLALPQTSCLVTVDNFLCELATTYMYKHFSSLLMYHYN